MRADDRARANEVKRRVYAKEAPKYQDPDFVVQMRAERIISGVPRRFPSGAALRHRPSAGVLPSDTAEACGLCW